MDISALLAILADPKVLALVSPLVVGGVKAATDKLPKWSLPVLSVLVGALLSALGGDAGLASNALTGALAGAAGIGVRELVDHSKTAVGIPGGAAK
jgi:hypothetical protein